MLATEWEKIDHFIDILVPKYAEQAYVLRTEIETLRASLRALRERDEKRWEMVGRAETVCRANGATALQVEDTYRWLAVADSLREAREGK